MDTLPDEILDYILLLTHYRYFLSLALTNRRFKNILTGPFYWNNKTRLYFILPEFYYKLNRNYLPRFLFKFIFITRNNSIWAPISPTDNDMIEIGKSGDSELISYYNDRGHGRLYRYYGLHHQLMIKGAISVDGVSVIRYLLREIIAIDDEDKPFIYALDKAYQAESIPVINFLFNEYLDILSNKYYDLLYDSVIKGNIKMFSYLIDVRDKPAKLQSAIVLSLPNKFYNLLHGAIRCQHANIVERLILLIEFSGVKYTNWEIRNLKEFSKSFPDPQIKAFVSRLRTSETKKDNGIKRRYCYGWK